MVSSMSEEITIRSYGRLWLYLVPGGLAVLLGLLKSQGRLFGEESETGIGFLVAGVGGLLILYGVLLAVVRWTFGAQIEIGRLLWQATIPWSEVHSISTRRRGGKLDTHTVLHAVRDPVYLLAVFSEQMLTVALRNGKSVELKISLADLSRIRQMASTRTQVEANVDGRLALETAKGLVQNDLQAAKRTLAGLVAQFADSDIGEEAHFLLRNIR